jgi:hypothetical protein
VRLRHLEGIHRDERGVITGYFVGIVILLLGITALGFDIGLLQLQRRVAQNSVDPAVLAGAAYLEKCALAAEGGDPLVVAEDFAERNLGVGSGFVTDDDLIQTALGSFHIENDVGEADWQTVRARVTREQGYLFGRAFGLVSAKVPAEAEATCGPISEGTICPMWIEGDRTQEPVTDAEGNVVSAYGLQIGKVYGMKVNDGSDHYGALDPPNSPGGGTDPWRDFIANGCEEDGAELDVCEGDSPECEVGTKPGNFGNPVLDALEGGGGGTGGAGLYLLEKTDDALFPDGHLSCDLHLIVDPADVATVLEVRRYSGGVASTSEPIWELNDPDNDDPATVVDAINEMTDPSVTPAVGGSPCGGLILDAGPQQGTPVPDFVFESVQGRFMYIAMTDGPCPTGGEGGSCQLPVLGILRMYIVCWTNQEEPDDGQGQPGEIQPPEACVLNPTNGDNDTTIYGVFADFKAPNLLGGGGLGTNPLAPFHVVLVQ